MTPQDVALLTALAALVKQVGTWPALTVLLFVVIGPWIGMFLLNRIHESRHRAVVKMYEDNVILVKNYETTTGDLKDILVLSTQTMTKVQFSIDSNLFCPLMRKDQRVEKTP